MADQNVLSPNLSLAGNEILSYLIPSVTVSFIQAAEFGFDITQEETLLGGDLSLAYFTVGAPCSLLIGYLADKMDRIKLLFIIVTLGEGPCFCTIFVTQYWQLVILRALTGIAAGGALPLMYSLLVISFL